MSDITINYKGNAIATMNASGTTTLLTEGKYLEDNVKVVYVSPGGGGASTLAALCNGTMTEFDDDEVTSVTSQNLLRGNTTITRIFLKNCKSITQAYALAANNCQTCVLPALETMSGGLNFQTSGFRKIDFGPNYPTNTTGLGNGYLSNATNLTVLILRKSAAIVPMNNSNALNNTPFKSGGTGGTIYIPKALYDHLGDNSALDYKAASNWSTYDGYGTITWAKIEGSIYETAYADGTPIT